MTRAEAEDYMANVFWPWVRVYVGQADAGGRPVPVDLLPNGEVTRRLYGEIFTDGQWGPFAKVTTYNLSGCVPKTMRETVVAALTVLAPIEAAYAASHPSTHRCEIHRGDDGKPQVVPVRRDK